MDDLTECAPASSKLDRPGRSRRKPRPGCDRAVYSAIDLGTNNCRLLIARPHRNGFRVIDAFSRIVRLGEGLSATGRLSEEAIARSIDALRVCAGKIRGRRVTCMRAVATEACRVASNRESFLERVREETGLNLEVISPEEEARLAVIGCQSLIDPAASHILVFDIGGGSTELIFVERCGRARFRILEWISVPLGVVTVSERFHCREPDRSGYETIVSLVKRHLEQFVATSAIAAAAETGQVQLIGTSGTVTTLASLELGLKRYDRNRVDGSWIEAEAMRRIGRSVAFISYEERCRQPCIGEDRAEFIVAGCGLLEAILDIWHFDRLRIADRGLREGVLRSMMGAAAVMGP